MVLDNRTNQPTNTAPTEQSAPTYLWIQEEFVNATEGHRFSSGDAYETCHTTIGDLYRDMRDEYGRCTGSVYVDTKEGTHKVGWVFVSRQKYTDCDDTYLREVWVTVVKPAKVMREVDTFIAVAI